MKSILYLFLLFPPILDLKSQNTGVYEKAPDLVILPVNYLEDVYTSTLKYFLNIDSNSSEKKFRDLQRIQTTYGFIFVQIEGVTKFDSLPAKIGIFNLKYFNSKEVIDFQDKLLKSKHYISVGILNFSKNLLLVNYDFRTIEKVNKKIENYSFDSRTVKYTFDDSTNAWKLNN